MKFLVGAACIAVIALAVYVIGGDYMASRAAERQAFSSNCKQLSALGKNESIQNMSEGEKFRMQKRISDCLEYFNSGKLPK